MLLKQQATGWGQKKNKKRGGGEGEREGGGTNSSVITLPKILVGCWSPTASSGRTV